MSAKAIFKCLKKPFAQRVLNESYSAHRSLLVADSETLLKDPCA